ncbi:conserved membrane hypothetical protein [Candidatus Sulfopaludibacter sp. SbA6]|nr:conserved membrane hypothetical protein [Candidatus Sulfopaludibacter sp. SbA6]
MVHSTTPGQLHRFTSNCYREDLRASILVAALSVLAVFTWQALVVHYNYAGNWTGLYCLGDRFPQPPGLTERLWLFTNTYGYDGQWYHLIAHDPWQKRGFDRFIDSPRIRYHRILLPGLAHLLAAGQDRYIHAAYLALVLLSIFLGSFWIGRYAGHHGLTPWLGLAFLLVPAVLVTIDRLTVDAVLACLCVGFILFLETDPGWPLYLVLLAAPLARETGFVLVAGYVAALLLERQFRRAALFSTAALPAAAWFWLVSMRTAPSQLAWIGMWPLAGYAQRILHPYSYPLSPPVAFVTTLLDYAALAGIGLAIVWAVVLARGKKAGAATIPILAFAVVAAFLNLREIWDDAYAFGRVLTPLLLLLALAAVPKRRWTMALPLLLVTPRIALQFAPQALHIVRGMLG